MVIVVFFGPSPRLLASSSFLVVLPSSLSFGWCWFSPLPLWVVLLSPPPLFWLVLPSSCLSPLVLFGVGAGSDGHVRFSWATMHAVSRVRNTQSRAQDELSRQQGKGKQAPDVPDNSRTVHAVLSNNNSTAQRCARQTCTCSSPNSAVKVSDQVPFPSPHATFLVLAWQALVRDLWSTPVVR